mmetsp:Transcript_39524/g.85401  ORF Transcript_39524/g.85401 Transcript_39524/m.85401 type:complete len:84 (-) Transcript_39524:120-371(-)
MACHPWRTLVYSAGVGDDQGARDKRQRNDKDRSSGRERERGRKREKEREKERQHTHGSDEKGGRMEGGLNPATFWKSENLRSI